MDSFEKNGPNLDQIHHSIRHMRKWLAPKSKALCEYLDGVVETQKNLYIEAYSEVSL
jgi:hypothetical protein